MPDKKIKLTDERKVSAATGLPIKQPRTGEYDYEVLSNIVKAAKDEGVDPYDAIAISLQESRLGLEHENLGQVNFKKLRENPKRFEEHEKAVTGDYEPMYKNARSLAFMMKQSNAEATGLGKKEEADRIQAYNGYGKLGANNDVNAKTLYGIDLTKNTIDMAKTPLYGRTIVDIRDNIIKKNTDIADIVNAFNLEEKELEGLTVSHANNKYTFKRNGSVVGEVDGEKQEMQTKAAKNAFLRSLYLKSKQAKADQTMAVLNKTLAR